jgi:hypothetical protein
MALVDNNLIVKCKVTLLFANAFQQLYKDKRSVKKFLMEKPITHPKPKFR